MEDLFVDKSFITSSCVDNVVLLRSLIFLDCPIPSFYIPHSMIRGTF